MDKKATGIVAYISIIGWLIAFFAGDREGAKFHLNQALILAVGEIIVGILSAIPIVNIVAGMMRVFLVVGWLFGVMGACKGED